jgi:hypothetical protein
MSGDHWHAWLAAHRQRGDELLARIDEHLERGVGDMSSEHLARGAELEASLAAHLARWEELYVGERDPHDEWSFRVRQDSLRAEQAFGELSQSLIRRTHEFVRYFVEEGRAHRDALAKVVDGLEPADALVTARG